MNSARNGGPMAITRIPERSHASSSCRSSPGSSNSVAMP
jgi:hypothetical protein